MKFAVVALTSFAALLSGAAAQDIIAVPVPGGLSGDDGKATRYWDCCKPSCAYSSNIDPPVQACEADGVTRAPTNAGNGCIDSTNLAFACTDQHSWVVNSTFALGYVGASFVGGLDYHLCCACFLLTYQGSTGKQLLVQMVNGGADYTANQFDISMPGGGVGYYTEGCTKQWGAPVGGWGEQYGGVTSEAECSELPTQLQEFCHFRFQFLEDVSNLNIHFQQVKCPTQLTQHTGCVRSDEGTV